MVSYYTNFDYRPLSALAILSVYFRHKNAPQVQGGGGEKIKEMREIIIRRWSRRRIRIRGKQVLDRTIVLFCSLC
jgi:hypothetical protein